MPDVIIKVTMGRVWDPSTLVKVNYDHKQEGNYDYKRNFD